MFQYRSLHELLRLKAETHPHKIAHWILDEGGHWKGVSFIDFYREVVDFAWKLKESGVEKGQVVAIMAATSREWELVHHAVLLLGCVVVGIDPNETSEHVNAIAKIADVQVLLIDRVEYLDKFIDINQFFSIVAFGRESSSQEAGKLKFINIFGIAKDQLNTTPLPDCTGATEIATILFTSGTTGIPKGIAYRHDQFLAAIDSILDAFPELSQSPCNLACWLPLSNLFQRMVNLCAIAGGAEVYFVNQPQKVIEYLPEINPHIFVAVPRFYEKLYQGLEAKLNQQPKIVLGCLQFCMAQGERDSALGALFRLINRRLFRGFTGLFGKNIRYMIAGSAPTPVRLLKRFKSLGFLILEGYGLSENIVPVATNRPNDYRFGSVGKTVKGSSVKLADDQELLVKGIGVYAGYLGSPDYDHNINPDGYLATGDYAEIDPQGFIYLTGRKSEVFKTSTGRKIAPVEIEVLLGQDSRVEHAVVFGENRKFLTALVTVTDFRSDDADHVIAYSKELALSLAKTIAELPDFKRPVGLLIRFKSLAVNQQELTSNLKLRRRNIQKNFQSYLDELYQLLTDSDSVIHHRPVLKAPELVLLKLTAL